MLQEVIDTIITERIVANEFQKCALCPWNPKAVKIQGEKSTAENDWETNLVQAHY